MKQPETFSLPWTALSLAKLVQKLRSAQKISGEGYKPGSDFSAITALEKQVDAAIAQIEKTHVL
jgi:hypothetical protein